jgi:uncharacterized membrane protein
MDNIFIGGGEIKATRASKMLKVAPLFISLLFVIISLGTMPGTIGHKAKYVRKDDLKTELGLQQISIPVALLSVTILLIIGGIVLNIQQVKDYIKEET